MENVTSDFNATPQSSRLHIALFGRRNVGKSSLINAITGQPVALVADVPGTTTDPVRRAMEIAPLGPCLLIDTAGFDDTGSLGEQRTHRTSQVVDHTDLALLVTDGSVLSDEQQWMQLLGERKVPTVVVLNKVDLLDDTTAAVKQVQATLGVEPIAVSASTGRGIDSLIEAIVRAAAPQQANVASLTGGLVHAGDTVLLVMPQDAQAPAGRLILPQVQTIRDLLDHECTVVGCTPSGLSKALAALREPPALIITDSQVFDTVDAVKPATSRLTSFSVLLAAYKGDIGYLADGARAIERLTPASRVLIAEACTHAPLSEDIGRVKIPRLLHARLGNELTVDVKAGHDWPDDLAAYDLIIHCGGCMINARQMRSRIEQAKAQHVAMTNYGLAIAHLRGILDRITLPNADNS